MIHRRKRIVVLSVFLFATALLSFAYFYRRYPDPVYAGLPFSEHLYRMYDRRNVFPVRRAGRPPTSQELEQFHRYQLERQASYHALTNVGTEALPLLRHWLTAQPPGWTSNLQIRLSPYFPRIAANRRKIALTFLGQFSVEGSGQLFPLIVTVVSNKNAVDQRLAAAALARIALTGKNIDVDTALRALLPISYGMKDEFETRALGYYIWNVKYDVDRAIERIDPQRVYHPLIVLELGPLPNRVGAARELEAFPRMPERAVPLLIANLSSTNRSVQEHCAITLGSYREQAKPALPALSNLLSHPRERLRVAASNAISNINATDALTSR